MNSVSTVRRNAATSSVRRAGIDAANRWANAARQLAQPQAAAWAGKPTVSGRAQAGSSQKMRSAPASTAASAQARTKSRKPGLDGHAALTGVVPPSTWHWRGLSATHRLSASPPKT
jgi:hypothetical protein